MATETDICNLAVRRLGEMALLVDVNENSTYAEVAKQSYPIVRDALLERHAWNFATTRVRGQLLAEKPIGWQFGYQVPAACLRMLSVYAETRGEVIEQEPWVFEMQGAYRVVLTNIENAVLKFIQYTENSDLYSPGFVDALAWHLAASLAGPIIKGETGMTVATKLLQQAQYFERQAIQADVRQRRTIKYEPVDFIDRGSWDLYREGGLMSNEQWLAMRK